MPDSQSHIEQAKHNKEFFDSINKLPFPDWMTTVIFYTAVHHVDYFLNHFLKQHPNGHNERTEYIRNAIRNKGLFSINFWKSYSRLLNDSKLARYEPDKWKNVIDNKRIIIYLQDLDVIKNRK